MPVFYFVSMTHLNMFWNTHNLVKVNYLCIHVLLAVLIHVVLHECLLADLLLIRFLLPHSQTMSEDK